ncbi:MAG TPA: DUF2189 domain-containing protein [Rhizomicrobium sp.]|jgi:uncharacterized membrane protein|nr:DUF2189 domain-containing protein [Rhizomicrobium sp.]
MSLASHVQSGAGFPHTRHIGLSDLRLALESGIADFRDLPSFAVFLCLFYPLAGLFLGGLLLRYDVAPLLFPLVAGFALVGPFAAIGLYELSRRLELGLDTSWEHAFDVFRSPAKWSVFALGVLLTAIFIAWLLVARWLYAATLGQLAPHSIDAFVRALFTTGEGWKMIIWGNLVGLLFAVVAMSISVVSFPLLLDRHVSAPMAMLTSVRAVLDNPRTMAAWGLIVAAGLIAGSIPFLLGLAVVIPVLGHATWHLYRRVVTAD